MSEVLHQSDAGLWCAFFPPGESVVALPSWRRPRLYIPANGLAGRWRGSGWLPAYRPAARALRLAVRAHALTPAAVVAVTPDDAGSLSRFFRSVFKGGHVAGVRVGMPGPCIKFTARIEDARGCVIAYVKCLNGTRAAETLDNEAAVIAAVAPRLRPAFFYRHVEGEWNLLVLAPLHGVPVEARLPPPQTLHDFTRALPSASEAHALEHPWFLRLVERRSEAIIHIAALGDRSWAVGLQHGDLAPWNLVASQDGTLAAFDWEDGTLQGLSLADHAHYVLQACALVHRLAPTQARSIAARWLGSLDRSLQPFQAAALVRLAALSGYLRELDHGHTAEDAAQKWRMAAYSGE